MTDLNIEFKLDRIHCHDEDDKPGNAEPYLWTVFFKIDGDTLVVNSDGPAAPFLQGAPTVTGTPGNQGNLGTTDVDEGDDVIVPSIIGEHRTIMKPIPLTTPLLGLSEVGGMIGCIVVLMEEDHTPNSAIALGHEALDRAVRDKLAEVLGTLSIGKTEPSDEDIAALTRQIGDAVESAVGSGVSILDWFVGLGDMDNQVGSALLSFSHKQLEEAGGMSIPFSRRWDNEGDWELFGHIKATPIRRAEPKCCEDLKRKMKELEGIIAEHTKRLTRLEDRVDGFANVGGRKALIAKPAQVKPRTRNG